MAYYVQILHVIRRSQSTVEITAARCIGEAYGREKVIMATIEQLVGIIGQQNEIVVRIGNGSLDPPAVKRALQDIIEGKLPTLTWNLPTWWRTPEQQLARARQLWPNAVLPEPPKEFTPWTKSEVLLLHVPDTFDSLWDKVVAPTGYTKHRWESVKADGRNLRLSPNKREYMEPVWLAFDPEHGKGVNIPNSFWGQTNIAAGEVFSALIQFPEWPLAWFSGASAPTLSGYQLAYDDDGSWWSRIPCLNRLDGTHLLRLVGYGAGLRFDDYSSPSVREC